MVHANEEKVDEIGEYELVVVGSGIQINNWTGESEKFLKKFRNRLANKKVALFVSCGSACQGVEGKPKATAKARRKCLEEKAAEYNLQPVALGFFGGVYDYNKTP